MAQLDFPLNPALHQVYTAGQGSWIWDGIKWESNYSAQLYLPLIGGSLAGPGNLAVGGTLNVTGATTLAAATGVTMATTDSSLNFATTAFVKNVSGLYLPLSGGTLTGQLNGTSCTFSGNVIGNNSVQSNGVYFQNNSGWFYSPSNILSGGAVGVAGNTGMYWTNSGGWMYSPNSVNAAGNIQANAGLIAGNSNVVFNSLGQTMYPPGDGWLYFNGSFRVVDFQSNNNVNAAGVVYVNGMYWQNNGGWMYTPWQLNTGGALNVNGNGQFNGNNVYCGNTYTNGTAYGGWGAQYNWTGNGYWVSFQCTDAFYTYNNQSLAGGVYWTYCDERMKWDFRPVTRDCLAAINAIELKAFDFSEGAPRQRIANPYETRPEYFLYEELPRKVKHIETGFIAQQLREIIPEAVPDPPEEGAYLSVDMRPMVATLIGAMQQLTARLAALEGK